MSLFFEHDDVLTSLAHVSFVYQDPISLSLTYVLLNGRSITVSYENESAYNKAVSNLGSTGVSLQYKLYAYSFDMIPNSYGYAEKESPVVGDILYLPTQTGHGPITDAGDLTQVFEIIQIASDGVVYARQPGTSASLHFTRHSEHDYTEAITDVRDLTDLGSSGLHISQKGTVFKAINVNFP